MLQMNPNRQRLMQDVRGNVALIFGAAAIPLVLAVGVGVDYGRALLVRERMQSAIDNATLAVGSWQGLSNTQMQAKAQEYFNANYPVSNSFGSVSPLNLSTSGNTIVVSVSASVPTTFMKLANIDHVDVGASTTVAIGMGTAEVALALDNSGSMSGSKINALKTAASDLVDTLFTAAQNSPETDPIKIAIVPFAAGVNVGPQYGPQDPNFVNAGWMDTTGIGKYHAYEQKCYAKGGTLDSSGVCSVNVGTGINNFTLFDSLKTSSGAAVKWAGCVEARPMPYDATDDPTSINNPSTWFVPMFAPDEPDNWTCSTSGSSACSYYGSSNSNRVFNGAPAGSYSFNNYLPDAGDPNTCTDEFATLSSVNASTDVLTASAAPASGKPLMFQSTGSLPGGLSATTLYYPIVQSGNTFKVSTSSNGSAVNLTSSGSGTIRYAFAANWTCQSGSANCAGTNFGKSEQSGFGGTNVSSQSQCKYGKSATKATVANITDSGLPGGPNFMCTSTPVLPLSTNKTTIKNAINAMVAQGATGVGEGAAWGWRALSPGAPFTEGRPYSTKNNTKVLVLMTDGQNTYYPNSHFLKSLYDIYGYVGRGQLGTTSTSSSTLTQAMDQRTAQTCANIKAAGITVYTVAFQIPGDEADALALLNNCASDKDKYFAPGTEAELLAAFTAIGRDISELRLAH